MSIGIHTLSTVVDIPVCILIEHITSVMSEDAELQVLQAHTMKGWSQNKDKIEPSLGEYQLIGHSLAMIDGVVIKANI